MRRSAAPSRKRNSAVSKLTESSTSENLNSGSTPLSVIPSENSVRSTSFILNILKETVADPAAEKHINTPPAQISGKENVFGIPTNSNRKVYNVLWGKKTTKKHKTWEGDGILEVKERCATLIDEEGNVLGRITNMKTDCFEDGSILSVGSKEVQIIELAPKDVQSIVSVKRPSDEQKCNPRHVKKSKNTNSNIGLYVPNVVKRKGSIIQKVDPLLMPKPPPNHQWTYNVKKKSVTDVSVDYCLNKMLRPHQRLGVVFLYECVMGFKEENRFGAILADEMGLGKTLQCITLIWTLLKQGPYGDAPVIKRVLIVTPSSLTGNWEKEFQSWLGRERIRTFVVSVKNKLQEYMKLSHIPVLIISYEMFVRYFNELSGISFELIICDEGHRLKNNNNKASNFLSQLQCKRRVILSGTPIQNDLQEFFALADFVNPGFLGTNTEYKKYFEQPILASREPSANDEVKELGMDRATELNRKTGNFILRRTQEVIDKYLPMKTETVILCKSSLLQQKLYASAVHIWEERNISSRDISHLSVITTLKKICNHPSLIKLAKGSVHNREDNFSSALIDMIPSECEILPDDSGKLKVLLDLLKHVSAAKENIVVVSSYTQTLDMLANIFNSKNYDYCRLDGSVPSNQRTSIVDNFNNCQSKAFVFLLSAKAGGVGLNLIGASRLILFDSDWNPATDLQAMSRVWRDGQKKSVYLYRFLTAGTVEEKIYQRQISKTGLSGTIVDPNSKSSVRLSDEELKDLFSYQFDVDCSTHSLLNCECPCDGTIPEPRANVQDSEETYRDCQLGVGNVSERPQSLRMHQLMQWAHHRQPFDKTIMAKLLLTDVCDDITFVFRNECVL